MSSVVLNVKCGYVLYYTQGTHKACAVRCNMHDKQPDFWLGTSFRICIHSFYHSHLKSKHKINKESPKNIKLRE